MANKFQDLMTDAIENALSEQRTLIDTLLRRLFWDDSQQDHLVDSKLYDEFIELINNPNSFCDDFGETWFKLNGNKTADFVKRFRDDLRKNKERI